MSMSIALIMQYKCLLCWLSNGLLQWLCNALIMSLHISCHDYHESDILHRN